MSKGEVVMKTHTVKVAKWTTALAVVPFGLFLSTAAEARPAVPACESSPTVKNLMALTYRAPCTQAVVHEELSKKEAIRLTATAESSADHLKLARYYSSEANRLDGQATGYEQAAVTYRNYPDAKNLTSPTTPGRFEFVATELRHQAESNRLLAIRHEKMAQASAAL
jgi:hypothetical protein